MKTFTAEELAAILKAHEGWWRGEGGNRADLSWANLYGADLYGANLYGADLSRADLSGANLSWANLYGADLYGANLYGANLYGANLSRADLSGANLYGANLSWANLYGADLSGANLSRANLSWANLSWADLSGAKINWQSHNLVAQILLRDAEQDIEKRKIAGLILISTDWCWNEFLTIETDMREWALDTLAEWVQEDDNAPDVLRKRKKVQAKP